MDAHMHGLDRRQAERRNGIEKRTDLFKKLKGGLRKCWERRSYTYATERRTAPAFAIEFA